MLITETVTINGATFTHNYSNEGKKIRQNETQILYNEAYDSAAYTYTETDIPVDDDMEEEYAAAGRILLGREGE